MPESNRKSCIFQADDLIGEGTYSKVYKSNKFTEGSVQTTAVKVYQKNAVNYDVISHAKRQQNILKNIDSQYVCSNRQSFQSKNKFYMVQKLQKGTTLQKIIKDNKRLGQKQVTKISKAILKGIEYLNSKRIMHRDLKPSNIMYNQEAHKAVLLDLGFATYFHKNDQKVMTSIVGTPNYMSPQILMGKKYNSQSDVWSFGVIMYEMLCGQVPFKGINQKQILNCILTKKLAFKSNYSPTLQWLIINCLKIDTDQRLKWQDLFLWMNTGKLIADSRKRITQNSVLKRPLRKNITPTSVYYDQQEPFKNNCECLIY